MLEKANIQPEREDLIDNREIEEVEEEVFEDEELVNYELSLCNIFSLDFKKMNMMMIMEMIERKVDMKKLGIDYFQVQYLLSLLSCMSK